MYMKSFCIWRLPSGSYFDFCCKPNFYTESQTRANVIKDDAFLVLNIESSGEDPYAIYHLMMKVHYICSSFVDMWLVFCRRFKSLCICYQQILIPPFFLTGQKIRFKPQYGSFINTLHSIVIVGKDSVTMKLKYAGEWGKCHGWNLHGLLQSTITMRE